MRRAYFVTPEQRDDTNNAKRFACFISPHGFGHASRAAAVMQAISDIDTSVRFEIFTTVPSWFFQDSMSAPFNCHTLLTDIGMIQKIISGGQTGVDRAALDAAIKLTIPHGGWIPQGRLTEDGPLPPEYQLQETGSNSYADRTEKNVLNGDATLIISRGPLTGGSEYTREMAIKHNRLWLHIDLKKIPAFQAAIAINDWISKKGIAILNVAGPRASKDPKIYKDTLNILESSYYLGLVHGGTAGDQPASETINSASRQPQNIDEAVERLISQMPLKDKTTIANMSPDELPNLYLSLGDYIMNNFGLLSGNHKLMESCRLEADGSFRHEEDTVPIIIKALWEKLRRTHKLRVIK